MGLVVHGLWPQDNDGKWPESCSTTPPVASATVDHMMPIMPGQSLIQHEWAKHGTCSGLSTQDYFAAIEKLYTGLQVPEDFKRPSSSARDQSFQHRERICHREPCSGRCVSRLLSAERVFRSGDMSIEGPAIPGVPQHTERMPRPGDCSAAGAVRPQNSVATAAKPPGKPPSQLELSQETWFRVDYIGLIRRSSNSIWSGNWGAHDGLSKLNGKCYRELEIPNAGEILNNLSAFSVF